MSEFLRGKEELKKALAIFLARNKPEGVLREQAESAAEVYLEDQWLRLRGVIDVMKPKFEDEIAWRGELQ